MAMRRVNASTEARSTAGDFLLKQHRRRRGGQRGESAGARARLAEIWAKVISLLSDASTDVRAVA
jgi:hypothetical protein